MRLALSSAFSASLPRGLSLGVNAEAADNVRFSKLAYRLLLELEEIPVARIILAEDDDIAAEAVVDALMGAGHAVAHFENGAQALAAMRFRIPNVAILDCGMPVMNGIETLRAIRTDRFLYRLPVLILTARDAQTDEDIALYEGANAYMRKPFDPDDLVIRVEALANDPVLQSANVDSHKRMLFS